MYNKNKESDTYFRFNKSTFLFWLVLIITLAYIFIVLLPSSTVVCSDESDTQYLSKTQTEVAPTITTTEKDTLVNVQENNNTTPTICSTEPTKLNDEQVKQDNTIKSINELADVEKQVTEEPETQQHDYYDVPLSKDLQDFVFDTAEEYNIPAGLIFTIMDVESSFRTDVISGTNDYGLCQINICNHEWLKNELGLDNMLDPYQNITACAYIYSDLLEDNNGDINLAAMCYNCGSGGAANLWNQGIYSTDYSRKIVNTYEEKYAY